MWEHGRVLDHDIFSYPYSGAEWINHQWLAQVLTYAAFFVGGPQGIVLGRCALLLVALAVVWRVCRKEAGAGTLATCAVLFAGLFAMSERILERPHLFSLVFTAVYLWVIEVWAKRRDGKFLLPLVPLQILWANLHGGFVLGPLICLLGGAGEAVNRRNLRPLLWGIAGFALLLAASLINPFGWKIFGYIHDQWFSSVAREVVVEWRPPFAAGGYAGSWERWFYLLYLALFLFSCAALAIRHDVKRLLWALLGVFLFLTARRYADTLVFLSAPFIADNLTQIFGPLVRKRPGIKVWARAIFAGSAILALAWVAGNGFWKSGKNPARFGWGISRHAYPLDAADFIERNHLRPNLFHEYNCGSYLAERFYGKYPVFIDGRNLVYSDAFFRDYLRLFQNPAAWDRAIRQYGIRTVLLLHGGEGSRIVKNLWDDPQWKLVFLDSDASVFAANIPDHASIADIRPLNARAFAVDEKDGGYPRKKLALAAFYLLVGDGQGAQILLDKALTEYPNNLQAAYLKRLINNSKKNEKEF